MKWLFRMLAGFEQKNRHTCCGQASRSFFRNEEGGIIVLSLFLFIAMILIGGIAVDMMRYEAERVRVQGTADRAVLAAAMLRDNPANPDPEDVVRSYFKAEGLEHIVADSESIKISDFGSSREVLVSPKASMSTIFMRMSSVDSLPMNVVAGAAEGLAEVRVEIVMVLDVSGSMMDFERIENLRAAADDFVEEMLANNENGRVSISFVPYSTEVIMPPGTLTYFTNLDDPSSGDPTDAFCIDFHNWDSVTDSLNTHMFRRNCDLRSNTSYLITDMPIRPYMDDVQQAKDYIASLGPNWGTSIDLGVRTGAMFFDPTLRPVIQHLIDAGTVSSAFQGRPLDWNAPASYRALVLMTDGENCCFWAGNAATRKPSVEVQDADTVSVCDALKQQRVAIYGVAFEAPPRGVALMENCASSDGHFFNSSGDKLIAAFQSIATHIQTQSLRLTK